MASSDSLVIDGDSHYDRLCSGFGLTDVKSSGQWWSMMIAVVVAAAVAVVAVKESSLMIETVMMNQLVQMVDNNNLDLDPTCMTKYANVSL